MKRNNGFELGVWIAGLMLALFSALPAKADVCSMEVDASTSNVGTSFSTASTSKKSFAGCLRQVRRVCVENALSVRLVVACTGAATAPTDTDTAGNAAKRINIGAGKNICIDDEGVGNVCYVKGRSSASTGTYVITLGGF